MIKTIAELEAIYGQPASPSLVKVANHLTAEYRAYIEASPFVAVATVGPEGLDCSPRGDNGQVVFIEDECNLALPDWRGNNRIDTLKNIVRDPRVSLMFLVPGSTSVIRVNGKAIITADNAVLERFAKGDKQPRTVMIITLDEVYIQCARAVMRAGLWDGKEAPELPSVGDILAALTDGNEGGAEYDRTWPERAKKTLW